MESMDRRGFLRGVAAGGVVAAAAGAGLTLITEAAEAAPIPADKSLPEAMERWTEEAQYRRRYYRRPRYRRYWRRPYWRGSYWRGPYWRRRRRWVCWWRRGRRVCGWRYW